MGHKKSIAQILLCIIFGPAGLLYHNTSVAFTGILLTLFTANLLPDQLLPTWAIAVIVSCICGLALQHLQSSRDKIDNFLLSDYIGNVSCQTTDKNRTKRPHHKLLNKLRFRKRLHKTVNSGLTAMCLLAATFIAKPELFSNLLTSFTPTTNNNNNSRQVDDTPAAPPMTFVGKTDNGYVIKSSNLLTSSSIGSYRVKLDLSCTGNKTALSLLSADVLGTEKSKVVMQFDNGSSVAELWTIRDNYYSAYSPRPISTTKKILTSNQLTLVFQPFGSEDKLKAHFNSDVFAPAISDVRKRCHW